MFSNGGFVRIAFSVLAAVGIVSHAAEQTAEFQGKMLGEIDLRPQMVGPGTDATKYGTDNTVTLGYQFTKDVTLLANQGFTTNLYNPDAKTDAGLGFKLGDTMFQTVVGNIAKSGTLSLGYENRVYLPTGEGSRDTGNLAVVRNYLKLKNQFTSKFALTLSEVAIFHAYDQAGKVPGYENRVYLIPEIKFTDKLSLVVPVNLNTVFANGTGSITKYKLWIYPQLTYSVTDNYTIGANFISGNLANDRLSELDVRKGLDTGIVELVFNAAL